jgi:hypothetical protein
VILVLAGQGRSRTVSSDLAHQPDTCTRLQSRVTGSSDTFNSSAVLSTASLPKKAPLDHLTLPRIHLGDRVQRVVERHEVAPRIAVDEERFVRV